MAIERAHLLLHLELAAQAYGTDLALPLPAAAATQAPAPAPGPVPAAPPTPTLSTPPSPPPARPAPPLAPPPTRAAPAPAPPAPASAPAPAPTAPRTAGDGTTDDRSGALQDLRTEVLPCTRCKLHRDRIHAVFGEGDPFARVMFIGEAPGSVEDQTGRPFVGPAGQLLDRILAGAMGLQRKQVYIANVNKCRPPGNRVPEADEVAACLPFLHQQIAIVRPEVLVCLGRTAAQNLLGTTASTTALRGRDLEYRGIPVVVTWHPSYLLREPSHKRETWDDIKRVNRLLGLPEVPGSSGS